MFLMFNGVVGRRFLAHERLFHAHERRSIADSTRPIRACRDSKAWAHVTRAQHLMTWQPLELILMPPVGDRNLRSVPRPAYNIKPK